MREYLTRHLKEAEESYFEHLKFTVKMGLGMAITGFIIIIHGIFPFIMTKTASNRIEKISVIMKSRVKK